MAKVNMKDVKLIISRLFSFRGRKKFKELDDTFFDKIRCEGVYTLTRNLMVKNYNGTLFKFFPNELCKYANKEGLYKFKVKSQTQKRWEQEAISHIDMKAYKTLKFWWTECLLFWSGKCTI